MLFMGWRDRLKDMLLVLGFGYDENDTDSEQENFLERYLKPKPVDKALSRKIQILIDGPLLIYVLKLIGLNALVLVLNAWSYFTVWLRHFL